MAEANKRSVQDAIDAIFIVDPPRELDQSELGEITNELCHIIAKLDDGPLNEIRETVNRIHAQREQRKERAINNMLEGISQIADALSLKNVRTIVAANRSGDMEDQIEIIIDQLDSLAERIDWILDSLEEDEC